MKMKTAQDEIEPTQELPETEEDLTAKSEELYSSMEQLKPKVDAAWDNQMVADKALRDFSYESLRDNQLDYKETEDHQELTQAYETARDEYEVLKSEYNALYTETQQVWDKLSLLWQNAIPTPEAVQARKRITAILKQLKARTICFGSEIPLMISKGKINDAFESLIKQGYSKVGAKRVIDNQIRLQKIKRSASNWDNPGQIMTEEEAMVELEQAWQNFGREYELMRDSAGSLEPQDPPVPGGEIASKKELFSSFYPIKMMKKPEGTFYIKGHLKEAIGEPPGTTVSPTPRLPAISAPPGAPSALTPKPSPEQPIPPKKFVCPMDGKEYEEGDISVARDCPDHKGVKVVERKKLPPQAPPGPKSKMPGIVPPLASIKVAWNAICYADSIVEKVQAGNLSTPDALKEMKEKAKEYDWGKEDTNYIKDRLQGKVAELYTKTAAYHNKEIVLCYKNDKYKLFDLDYGCITPDNAKEKDIKNQLLSFGIKDTDITEALKVSKNNQVTFRIKVADTMQDNIQLNPAQDTATKDIDIAVTTATTELGLQAPRASLMMRAMDKFAELNSEELARAYQSEIKEKLTKELDAYDGARAEMPGTNQEIGSQQGMNPIAFKLAKTPDDSKKKELINKFKEQGITLSDSIEKKPKPWEVEDPRCLTAVGFSVKDKVRDQANPTLTGTILGFEGTNIRVAMDKSYYCEQGAEGIYMPEALVKIEDQDSEDLNLW